MLVAEPRRGNPRPRGWEPERVKEALRRRDASLRQILISLSTDKIGWRGLYADVCRWRLEDKELDNLIEEVTALNGRGGDHGGRPRKDAEDPDWKVRFCEAYLKFRSRNKAAGVTPYKPEEITKFLSPRYKEFDPKFADLVHATELQLISRAEEILWDALEESSEHDSPKDKAYVATQVLRYAPASNWGKQKMDVNVTGTVVNKFEISKQNLIAELVADQKHHFEQMRKQLEAGDAVDVEVVE